jgi:hypothetical protein
LAIRANDTGSLTDLSHDPLQRIVGPDLLPMDVRESAVGQRLVHAPLDKIGCGIHSGRAQMIDDAARLVWGLSCEVVS